MAAQLEASDALATHVFGVTMEHTSVRPLLLQSASVRQATQKPVDTRNLGLSPLQLGFFVQLLFAPWQ